MAVSILVIGVGQILKKVISRATSEIGHLWNVKDEMEKLVHTLTAIEALLGDVTENKVSKLFLHSISLAFQLKMARKIKNINSKLDNIKRDIADSFNFVSASIPTTLQNRKTIETFSFVDESEMVGRDDDKSKIVSMLTSSDSQDILLSVLPIVGMGGIGKTTLAKLVHNDDYVAKYFDERAWVHVSRDFDIKKVLMEITESLTKRTCQFSSTDVIQKILKDELKKKRFLLVLDDLWNVSTEKWDTLKTSLKIGVGVALMIGTLVMHPLKILSEDEFWSILKNKDFSVPLAAKTLGGLMRIKKDQHESLAIKDNGILSALKLSLSALKLSHDHLPSPLKQCFLYCSIFPKGDYILISDLVEQWMALGFLQPSTDNESMEDVGNYYCNYLLQYSLFQDPEKDHSSIVIFKMHDLVFDMAHSLSRIAKISVGNQELKNKSNGFYLTMDTNGDINRVPKCLFKLGKLRSLHFRCTEIGISNCSNVLDILLKKLKHLSVLDLSNCGIKELPSSIKKLKHLRYLNLMDNPIKALPTSITSLYNLETLNLICCPLKELPQDTRYLVNLRQLCSIKELQCLDLGGDLSVCNLENVRSREEAEGANLMGKEKLISLSYFGEVMFGVNLRRLTISNFNGENFPGWIMSGCGSFLPNLMTLSLYNCERLESVPTLGQLPSLKVLQLEGVKRMKSLGSEFYHQDVDHNSIKYGHPVATNAITTATTSALILLFPSIERDYLVQMPSLKERVEPQLQGSFPSFPRLEKIYVQDCLKLMIIPSQFPSFPNLEPLQHLPSLRLLYIVGWSRFASLPKQLRSLTQLEFLRIHKFHSVEALPKWFGNLSSLQSFSKSGLRLNIFKASKWMANMESSHSIWTPFLFISFLSHPNLGIEAFVFYLFSKVLWEVKEWQKGHMSDLHHRTEENGQY
ncbi:hypothetical protein NE237_003809 [Protea cynaroides]|uniref:NB-ARC domain-containing protein n=1 Tax=Protea cynaroides TaxID=273540 RepID=A0A9Q0QSY4_9MAGN|nr:hypothetical protein NE237_003809 [Protea cynaroides]